MTTLALADRLETYGQRVSGGNSLRTWLAGRWAIVFSHPDDFAQEQWEMDRWISVLSRSLSGHDVAAIALARTAHDSRENVLGQLAALGGEFAAVLTLEPRPSASAPLSADIASSGPRFAMIIDADPRCRRVLSYRLPAELPSPLDLIGWAVALRKRDEAGRHGESEVSEHGWPVRGDTRANWRRTAFHAGRV
jgi:hypothetical protein